MDQPCFMCGQVDEKVRVTIDGARHLGMDGCIVALKRALEQAQRHQPLQAPTLPELQEWYQHLSFARAQLVPQLLVLASEVGQLGAQMISTKERMQQIDQIILNVARALALQEFYSQQLENSALEAREAKQRAREAEYEADREVWLQSLDDYKASQHPLVEDAGLEVQESPAEPDIPHPADTSGIERP